MELPDDPLPRTYVQIAASILGVGLLVTSTAIAWSAVDVFRLPKEIAFRTEAILLGVLLVFMATGKEGWRVLRHGMPRLHVLLPLLIVVWTLVTTLTSTNRPLSEESLVTVVAAAVIFLVTRRVAPHLSLLALDVCLGIASINAVVVTLQEYTSWNPFVFPAEARGHISSTALIGNPNDVGSYLVLPALAAVIALATIPGRRRVLYALFTAVLTTGLIASGTRTAMIAFTCGVVVFALLRPLRQSLITLLIFLIAAGVVLRPSTRVGQRARATVAAARARRYDVLFSERLPPFLSAYDMFRSRPLLGLGPGTFKYHFMDARMEIEKRYPASWTSGWPMNFGETHNDHLQTAAETGLPGYLLFLTAVGVVGLSARRHADAATAPATARFAHALRPPLAVTFFVLCLAQFPLQIAAPRIMTLTLAALSLGWERPRE
jgi:O-antigen ligase